MDLHYNMVYGHIHHLLRLCGTATIHRHGGMHDFVSTFLVLLFNQADFCSTSGIVDMPD